jgi:putative endonuclease
MEDVRRREIGEHAEARALEYLQSRGCVLVERNFHCRGGEIDLVVLDHGTLALVEVRYRSRSSHGGAAGSVDWRKQRRLVQAARYLLAARPDLARLPARFDVIAMDATATGATATEWIRDAFQLPVTRDW